MSDGSSGSSSGASEDESFLRAVAAEALDDMPGLADGDLFGRYRLIREIGRGGMSVVFEARDVDLLRRVALKVLTRPRRDGEDLARRALAEARSMIAVRDPAVATLFDAGEIDGRPFLAMELVEGETLSRRLSRAGTLALRDAASILAGVARAAHAAHLAGVVHRDLKPDNVIVSSAGGVKVLDFGLARWTGSASRAAGTLSIDPSSSARAGTPGYAAPEQLAGLSVGPAADQFAIGVMLVELLTGRRASDRAWMGLEPEGARRLAERCMAAEPEERFSSAMELAEALEELGAPAPMRRPVSRAAAIKLSLVAAMVMLGAVWAALHPAPRTHQDAPVTIGTRAIAFDEPIVCAPLRVEDPVESGWLGAAASSLACRRIRAWRGGASGLVIPPARLLDLPSTPLEDFPRDPFSVAGARERALSTASEHAHLDGEVTEEGGLFDVHLRIVASSGTALGEATARGSLPGAVRGAVDALAPLLRGSAPREASAEVTAIFGQLTTEELVALSTLDASIVTATDLDEAAVVSRGLDPRFDPERAVIEFRLAGFGGAPVAQAAPPLDPSTPASLARSSLARLALGAPFDRAWVAQTLEASRPTLDPSVRSLVVSVEATLALTAGDVDRARDLSLTVVDESPYDAPWDALSMASYGTRRAGTVNRAYAAWVPEAADAWNVIGHSDDLTSDVERARYERRAYLLSGGFALFSHNYGLALVRSGQGAEARLVIARLSSGSSTQKLTAVLLRAELDLSEGRPGAALEGASKALFALDSVGSVERTDAILLAVTMDLARIAGREREMADMVARRFVLAEPPRIDRGPLSAARVAAACVPGSTEIAIACVERVRALSKSGFFRVGSSPETEIFLEGVELVARGNTSGAATTFRRIHTQLGLGERSVVGEAFEKVGDFTSAERSDPPGRGLYGGLGLADVRAARAAKNKGDAARARELARKIVAAWGGADIEIPALVEMRRLAGE